MGVWGGGEGVEWVKSVMRGEGGGWWQVGVVAPDPPGIMAAR